MLCVKIIQVNSHSPLAGMHNEKWRLEGYRLEKIYAQGD